MSDWSFPQTLTPLYATFPSVPVLLDSTPSRAFHTDTLPLSQTLPLAKQQLNSEILLSGCPFERRGRQAQVAVGRAQASLFLRARRAHFPDSPSSASRSHCFSTF